MICYLGHDWDSAPSLYGTRMMLSRTMRTHKASHFHDMTRDTSLFASKPRERLSCYLASWKRLSVLV